MFLHLLMLLNLALLQMLFNLALDLTGRGLGRPTRIYSSGSSWNNFVTLEAIYEYICVNTLKWLD